jgi:hypothetical protein
MKGSRVTESSIQAHILAQLSLLPGVAVFHPQKPGVIIGAEEPVAIFWRSNTGAARTPKGFVRFGVAGQADVTGCVRGRRVEIEVKSPTGRQRPGQREFQRVVEAAGGVYLVARSAEDATRLVRELLA